MRPDTMEMNRRAFLQCVPVLSGTTVAGLVTSEIRYSTLGSEIHVLRRRAGKWKIVQRVASERPTSLVVSNSGNLLFAVNEVGLHKGLPRGSVQSFAVDPSSGLLNHIVTQPLSLSSTFPRACALSPDDQFLAVAAYGGGTINILPVLKGGAIGSPCSVRKEIGSSAHPVHQRRAHPHSLAFDLSGRYLAVSDLGSDRVTVFSFSNGQLTLLERHSTPPGSGPGRIEVHSSRASFTVRYELAGTWTEYAWSGHG